MKLKRESARRRSHTRRGYNASGGGPKKIETQTQISPTTLAHAPHLQCKRSRPQHTLNLNANQQEDDRTRAAFTMPAVAALKKLKPKRKSDRRRSHRAAFTVQAVAAPTKSKPKRNSARRRLNTRRIHNASGGGPNVAWRVAWRVARRVVSRVAESRLSVNVVRAATACTVNAARVRTSSR